MDFYESKEKTYDVSVSVSDLTKDQAEQLLIKFEVIINEMELRLHSRDVYVTDARD